MEASNPNTALHAFLTAGAPEHVAEAVLQEAGHHVRLVSHAFHSLHPPLRAVTPNLTTTPEDLPAHLAALPSTLTSLNLRGLCYLFEDGHRPDSPALDYAKLITQPALSTIATSLPHLQELTLSWLPSSLVPALITTLQAHPALHTLCVQNLHGPHEHRPRWAPLLGPPLATRLRSLSIDNCEDVLCAAPPRSLPHLTSISMTLYQLTDVSLVSPPPPSRLANFCAAAPALRTLTLNLSPNTSQDVDAVRVLTAVTALTGLTLYFSTPYGNQQLQEHPTCSLLQHLGALTTLRNLSLDTPHNGWKQPEAGWLLRLTQLTSLGITFRFNIEYEWDDDDDDIAPALVQAAAATFSPTVAPATAEVGASIANLPLLQKLAISFDTSAEGYYFFELWLHCKTPNSFYQRLAAATQLRHLSLRNLSLPASEASQLTSLQQLTALQLLDCMFREQPWPGDGQGPRPGTLASWIVAAFPGLCHLSWWDWQDFCMAVHPCPAVGSLANLHTLAVEVKHGTVLGCPLEQQLEAAAAAGRLERLKLWDDEWECSGAGIRVLHQLQQLTRLRVLDLQWVRCKVSDGERSSQEPLLQHLQLPPSLRQCYLSQFMQPGNAALQRLQAAYPLVAFRLHARLDTDVW